MFVTNLHTAALQFVLQKPLELCAMLGAHGTGLLATNTN